MKIVANVVLIIVSVLLILSESTIYAIADSNDNVPSMWAANDVVNATNTGLTTRRVLSDFKKDITREEFCEMIVNLYNALVKKEGSALLDTTFTDTDNASVIKAYSLNIISGIGNGRFAPDNSITRQEICVSFFRMLKALYGDIELEGSLYAFDDSNEISSWAVEAVNYMYMKGLISGTGNNKISPKSTATREMAIVLVNRVFLSFNRSYDVQEGNTFSKKEIVYKKGIELEDNKIGALVSGVMNFSSDDWVNWAKGESNYGFKRYRCTLNESENKDFSWIDSEFFISSEYDKIYDVLVENGVKVTYSLNFWDIDYIKNGNKVSYPRFKTEAEIDRYLQYIKYTVNRLKGKISYYELWNEPDANGGTPQLIEAEDYIKVARKAIPLIHSLDPKAKVVIGCTSDYQYQNTQEYSKKIIASDITKMADAISLHTVNNDASPEYKKSYHDKYDFYWQEIKEIAYENGFRGEFIADELNFRTEDSLFRLQKEPAPERYNPYKSAVVAAKYIGRAIVRDLGLNLTQGLSGTNATERIEEGIMIKNLCNIMAGLEVKEYPIVVDNDVMTKNYVFENSLGELFIALWDDSMANERNRGVISDIVIPGVNAKSVYMYDTLNSYQQEIIIRRKEDKTIIKNFYVKDYPIILKIIPEKVTPMSEKEESQYYLYNMIKNLGFNAATGRKELFKSDKILSDINRLSEYLYQGEAVDLPIITNKNKEFEYLKFRNADGDIIIGILNEDDFVYSSVEDSLKIEGIEAKTVEIIDVINNTKTSENINISENSVEVKIKKTAEGLLIIKITPYNPETKYIEFEDENFEHEVMKILGKKEGRILKAEVESISHISIREKQITSLEGIQYFTNLKSIDAAMNNINDITPLKQLNNLVDIQLWNNKIENIESVKNMNQLEVLWIGSNGIRDISPIMDLVNLKKLGIWACDIKDISGLSRLNKLTEIDLRYNQVEDISHLSKLSNLEILYLTGNNINDYSSLDSLTNTEIVK